MNKICVFQSIATQCVIPDENKWCRIHCTNFAIIIACFKKKSISHMANRCFLDDAVCFKLML
jgi:hypothetical protein